MSAPDDLVAALRSRLGTDGVVDDPDLMAPHLVDWMRRYHGEAIAVVRPSTTEQVAAVLRCCGEAGIAVVPQGGNTGLVGGAVGVAGSVVVSTSRLTSIGVLDVAASQITVGAGATLAAVQSAAHSAGLRFPVDLAARGTATIGGMVATNAGGLAVLRFGTMRSQVAGIEAVLGDGSVISHLGGLVKDNTGYDLAGLLCGSEGTLGVITAVRLQLVPVDSARRTVAVGLATVDAAIEVLRVLRSQGVVIESAELVRRAGVALVEAHLGATAPSPFHAPFALVLELVDAHGVDDVLTSVLGGDELPVLDVAVAAGASQAAALWQWRERHTESISAHGVPVKLDVSLRAGDLQTFVDEIDALVTSVDAHACVHVFGHLGDGNLHVNVLGIDPSDATAVAAMEDAVLRRVVAGGGSISAEHGIGRMKAPWLHLNRSAAELAAMRAIKAALDPAGIMNPGVLLGPTPTLP